MTAPNLLSIATAKGDTDVLAVTTTPTDIVSTVATGLVYKVNLLMISNVDGTNAADITVSLYRSSTEYRLIKSVSVAAGTSFTALDRPLYLREGDSLRLTASADNDLEAVCSYEYMNE